MNQNIIENHLTDESGNPAGGQTHGIGITIDWQNGPLREQGEGPELVSPANGAFVEGVINAALGRLEFYQSSKFRCRENALAITKLEEAKHWLQHRTAERERLGVEGTHGQRDTEGQTKAA